MTESEAIKNLKDILSECTESEEAVCYITGVDAPALEKAIKAIEKNIPKQIVRRISKEEENRVYHHCDICGEWMTRMTNYCPNCGQKLDWRV